MLDFYDKASAHEKAYASFGQLPAHVDREQPPPRKAPFSTISHHPIVHTTDLILPKDVYNAVWGSILSRLEQPQYVQVIMPLSSLLEGEFFNTFIKTGAALMLSEGRPGVDDVSFVRDGIVTLELGKEKYERSGLTGKPIRSGARKHAKERFTVELDLRQPSMLHGKKGFERVVWACRNVLNASLTWLLLVDSSVSAGSLDQAMSLLAKHQPKIATCRFTETVHPPMYTPPLSADEVASLASQTDVEDYCNDLSEWLALVSLESPRISVGDDIDPYLSRYSLPQSEPERPQPSSTLVTLRWHGAMTANWVTQLFLSLLHEYRNRTDEMKDWAALSATAFSRQAVENADGYNVLAWRNSFMSWEFSGKPQLSSRAHRLLSLSLSFSHLISTTDALFQVKMGHDPHSYLTGDDPTLVSADMNDIWDDPFLSTANISLRNDQSSLPGHTGNITGIYAVDELRPSYLHLCLASHTPDILDKLSASNQPLGLTPWATPWEGKSTNQFLEELYASQVFYNALDDDTKFVPVPELTRSSATSSPRTITTPPITPTTSTVTTPRSGRKRKHRLSSSKTPSAPIKFVHDELSMPTNFRANPNNHARFKYHGDGTREYLNAPRKRHKVSSA
ncbi:hypothetical protein PISL3812_02056 [Talaromyces islandicus]|uniref:Uncharacterized protein n=1 Tax=Talaromyces islandicus TaxID=28573 RepID=A0A0U1LP31_TALIS|nr:hypothetical protein PISL3812_02056 [Talaromyces islandicus]